MMKLSHTLVIITACVLVVSGTGGTYAQGTLLERGREFLRKLDGPPPRPAKLTEADIADGLREALRVGSERVVETLGAKDGFNGRADAHIPLPKTLAKVQSTLNRFGVGHVAAELELRLNRVAEAAVPRAKQLFWAWPLGVDSTALDAPGEDFPAALIAAALGFVVVLGIDVVSRRIGHRTTADDVEELTAD